MSEYSYDALVVPNRQGLIGYAISLTMNKADADDLVQDTIVRAFMAWERFRVPEGEDALSCTRGWLFCILHNKFYSDYRNARYKRERLELTQDVVEGTYGTNEDWVNPEECDGGFCDEVSTALELLDREQISVVVRHASGMSYLQIAEELQIPIGTVMSRLYRGRKILGEELKDFAKREYGITSEKIRASGGSSSNESSECEETQAGSVDCIIVRDDDDEFLGAEGTSDSVSSW